MSWFDASSLTSYAKTALASAQKSIDKVLDIDEATAESMKNKNANAKGKEESKNSESVSTQKASGIKLQSTKTHSKPLTSTPKNTSQNESSVDGEGDFWSSFLGTSSPSPSSLSSPSPSSSSSASPSSSSSTSAAAAATPSVNKKPRTSTSSKQNDVKPQSIKKTDVKQTDILEKRRQRKRENRKNDSGKGTKNENKTENTTLQKDDKKEIYDMGTSSDAKNKNEKINISNKMGTSSSDSSAQQSAAKHPDNSKELNTSSNLKSQRKSEKVNDKQKVSDEGRGKDLGNEREISEQFTENSKRDEQICSSLTSQNVGKELEDNLAANVSDVNYNENEKNESFSPERLNDQSVAEGMETVDIISKSIGSSFHEAPKVTSTPYTGKLKVPAEKEQASVDDVSRSRETKKSLLTEGEKGRTQEQKESVKKEPVEDECDGEEVIGGSVYTVEDDVHVPYQDENLEKSSRKTVVDVASHPMKLPKDEMSMRTSPAVENRDHKDIMLVVTGELVKDGIVQDFVEEEKKEPGVSEKSKLEAETEAAQENTGSEEQNSIQVQTLLKEVSSLRELVDARENKMVSLSKENIDLQETNAVLRSQLEQLENFHKEDDEEFEGMKQEFITRIAATENQLNEAEKERDDLKRDLEETTKHLTAINERQKEELTTQISEKDEQILQLLAEGEKLSKQELQSNTIIKKLRAKEKENDTLIKKQTKTIEDYEDEVKRLTDILTSRDDSNSKQEDAIIKLNSYVKKQEEQVSKQTSELEDANEKVRSMQVALDNAYKEMTSLQKQAASTDSSIQEAVLSTEMRAKEELRIALEKTRREYSQDSELMALQISDLQTSLSRTEKQATRREEGLRQEIRELQQRIQEAEDRNQDLAASVSHATRPLLRQIENLQATHSGQASTWEMVEKNLTERLNEAQSQFLVAQERERSASQNVSDLNSRITRLESQVNSYRTERARLEAELELERTKVGSLEDAQSREAAKSDAVVKKYKKLIEEANLDKAHLEQQLAVEKSRLETELKKLKSALENKEKMLSRQSSLSSAPPPSPSAYTEPNQGEDIAEQKTSIRRISSSSSVVDGFARGFFGGTTELVERLQAQIRQKDGEIKLLQGEVTSLRQSRDSVMEELTKMTSELHGLETSHEQLTLVKAKYDDLEQRYNAVLQMYGEKEEEAEELRMDLQDVKSMYKQQLEQLFGSSS